MGSTIKKKKKTPCYATFALTSNLIPSIEFNMTIARNLERALFVSKYRFALLFFPADDNAVTLTEFEASPAGMINSFTARFPGNNSVLEELWRAEMPYHRL